MPVMLRPSKKATQIAYSLIGVPSNLRQTPKSKERVRFDERVRSITTRLVRGSQNG